MTMTMLLLVGVALKVPDSMWIATWSHLRDCYEGLPTTDQVVSGLHSLADPVIHSIIELEPLHQILIGCILLLLLWFVNLRYFSNDFLARRITVYWLAFRIIFAYQSTKLRIKWFGATEEAANELYERLHSKYSPEVYKTALGLGGFWIKVGQYMSSRSDVMPDTYVRELSQLQDAVPASPFTVVEQIIKEELGDCPSSLFASLQPTPIAAASIAQVHEGRLLDGTRVVVKIQHPTVARSMPQDFINLERIMSWVKLLDSSFNFKPVLDEWSKETLKELDFRHECRNLLRVIDNFQKAGNTDVLFPHPITSMVSERVMVMTFMKGFKITDTAKLDEYGVDRLALLRKVTQAYAQQIYTDGFFNGDPHPGNIMVQVKGNVVKPVLLDFGLTKEIDSKMRCAFGTLVSSAIDMDYGGLLQSFEEMGLKLNREAPMKDMEAIRFVLRDTAPPEEMRKDLKAYRAGVEKARRATPKSKRNPVDAWPGELLFFFRVALLLRALCATLGVRLPYMSVLSPYAKLALVDKYPEKNHAKSVIYPSPTSSSLDTKVRSLLRRLYAEGEFVGMQVCVYQYGSKLVDACAGLMGKTDPRPVEPQTLFNCFSVSKGVVVMCAHIMLDRGMLDENQKVAYYWPAFGQNGKGWITVAHLLSHQAGLQDAIAARTTVESVQDWNKMLTVLEQAKSTNTPTRIKTAYHYLSFGYLVGGLVEKVSGRPIKDFLRQEVAIPMGIENECYLGIDDISVNKRIASLSNGFGPDGGPPTPEFLQMMAEKVKQMRKNKRDRENVSGGIGDKNADGDVEKAEEFDLKSAFSGGISLMDPCIFNTASVRKACIPSANGHFSARALAKLYSNFCVTVSSGNKVKSQGGHRPLLSAKRK